MICWMRWMWDEKHAAITRPGASPMMSRIGSPASARRARIRAVRRWWNPDKNSRTPCRPSAASDGRSVGRLSIGARVEFEVAGMKHDPFGGVEGDRARIRHRVGDVDECELEGLDLHRPAGLDRTQICFDSRVRRCGPGPSPASAWCRRQERSGRPESREGRRCGLRGHGSRTTQTTSCLRSTSQPQFGKTRSTPSISSSGNIRPQSITAILPSISRVAQLRPMPTKSSEEGDLDAHGYAPFTEASRLMQGQPLRALP